MDLIGNLIVMLLHPKMQITNLFGLFNQNLSLDCTKDKVIKILICCHGMILEVKPKKSVMNLLQKKKVRKMNQIGINMEQAV